MLYLHFMNYLSLNIFLVISSLNTFILNQASTRIKFHTQNFNSGTYAVFQEEQLGKGTWVGQEALISPSFLRARYNTYGYYVFTAILDNFHLLLYINFSAFLLLYFLRAFQNGNYHCDIRCY